jgi:hypothetical protein
MQTLPVTFCTSAQSSHLVKPPGHSATLLQSIVHTPRGELPLNTQRFDWHSESVVQMPPSACLLDPDEPPELEPPLEEPPELEPPPEDEPPPPDEVEDDDEPVPPLELLVVGSEELQAAVRAMRMVSAGASVRNMVSPR